MAGDFNSNAKPTVKTEHFKIYIDVGNSSLTPTWEKQGKGISSWTVTQNQEITKEPDVLGNNEMTRGTAQQVQSGVEIKVRKGLAFSKMLFDAYDTGDYSALDNISILQKFEFVDAETDGYCRAKLQKGCLVAINEFVGEAGDYLKFNTDLHYSNDVTRGKMLKEDGATVTFIPDGEEEEEEDGEE